MSATMPAIFLPHGGGPWPFMELGDMAAGYVGLRRYLQALPASLPGRPSAVLIVSAHWETEKVQVQSARMPRMLYDYYNFPPETYQVQWPAPGAPEVAESVRSHLAAAGFEASLDPNRGFDHGTFVPMMLSYPGADVPTFQVSLEASLDPRRHLELGRALAPLREQGVLLIGSGMGYHNLRSLMRRDPNALEDSVVFDEWLEAACTQEADRRDTALAEWAGAPRARACHPREEHLLPLMVMAGAGGDAGGRVTYRDRMLGVQVSALQFG